MLSTYCFEVLCDIVCALSCIHLLVEWLQRLSEVHPGLPGVVGRVESVHCMIAIVANERVLLGEEGLSSAKWANSACHGTLLIDNAPFDFLRKD